jgi:hypothetical protein
MKHRFALAAALASLVALGSIGPVAAFEPNSQTNEMEDWTGPQQPVGPGQQAMAAKKLDLEAQLAKDAAARASGEVTVAAATTESYLVGTWERQQVNYYYCGPTAIQVEADYVWNMGPDMVKWKQSQISANWTHTTTAGTDAVAELRGANGVLVGSPRANWPYWSYQPTSGADWFNKMNTDLVLTMPQIVNLQPWWYSSSQGFWYYLADWASHQSTGGHWIVANGYNGAWDGTSGPTVRFDDGSAGYGGSTGTYWDVQYDMWQLILHHHDIVIW